MSFLLYGAYGYTGDLIAREAVRRGIHPILSGRDADKLRPLAQELGLDYRTVSLDDHAALDHALGDVPLVVHCAGPFHRTARPMAEACLRTVTHYIDITGEIEVFEALAAMDERAQRAGVMLLPGAGFDVVPTDCLALHLKNRLPTADTLEVAFTGMSGVSRGTATTAVERMSEGGAIRRDGDIQAVPPAWKTRAVDFGRGPKEVVSIPWGDVATAYYSTGIPNITTYTRLGGVAQWLMILSRYLGPLLGSPVVQAVLKWLIQRLPPGPGAEERQTGRAFVWAEVTDEANRRAAALLTTPEAYQLTAYTALAAAQKVLAGDAPLGYQTPAKAYGPDFILEIEGTARKDVG